MRDGHVACLRAKKTLDVSVNELKGDRDPGIVLPKIENLNTGSGASAGTGICPPRTATDRPNERLRIDDLLKAFAAD